MIRLAVLGEAAGGAERVAENDVVVLLMLIAVLVVDKIDVDVNASLDELGRKVGLTVGSMLGGLGGEGGKGGE